MARITWYLTCALMLSALVGAAPASAPASTSSARVVRRRVVALPTTQKAANSIPGIVSQQEMQKKIREIYATDYADTSFNGRRSLAKRLIEASEETKRDSDAKFVFLREARDLAISAGDVTTAFDAIDCMVKSFPLVKLNERVEVMRAAVPVLSTPQAHLAAASICMDLVDQCVVEADYERADVLLPLAAASSRAGKSVPYARWVETRSASIRPLKDAHDIARPAEAALARAPDDPQANLVVGKFVTFIKGDFDSGLLLLSKGSDASLAKLADQDLDAPADVPSLQFKTAGTWWDLAESQPVDYRPAIRRRAGFWYRRAVAGLDGLEKALAERRLLELNPPAKSGAKREHPPDALQLQLNSHFYRASIAEVTWETAQRLSQEAGGQLVCIETRAEGELMSRLARGRVLWLGASTDGKGKWSWLSGGEFFYANWSAGEPSNLTVESHPVIGSNGAWRSFNGRTGFICEWNE